MTSISLIGSASYMPAKIVGNDAFIDSEESQSGMFKGSRFRHHVAEGELAVEMIETAARTLAGRLNLNLETDVDIVMTNVSVPDSPFTGCGADLCHRLGIRPQWVVDMHNTGCVSLVFMMAHVRALFASTDAKTAIICNVQNAAGRVYAHEQNLARAQSRIPGDGCGVTYLVKNDASPVRTIVTRTFGAYADDMKIVRDDQRAWWQPSPHAGHIDFSENKLAAIVARGNRLVPEVIYAACKEAQLPVKDIDCLITNQPNPIFLRNWREAVLVPKEKHVNTFERHGNLFGAAIPICIEEAVATGALKKGDHLVLGGFSHAGDYAAAAVIDWQAGS